MPLRFKANSKAGDFKSVPAGTHIAVCNLIADLGLQPGSDFHPAPRHQIYIRFEVPGGNIDADSMVIGSTYTASMHEKANLRKHLEGWLGKRFSDEAAENFDIETILGKACILSVVETTKGDKIYSNIVAISGLPQGVSAPAAELPQLYYAEDSRADFLSLPNWLQGKIRNQIKQPEIVGDGTEITNDDIPF